MVRSYTFKSFSLACKKYSQLNVLTNLYAESHVHARARRLFRNTSMHMWSRAWRFIWVFNRVKASVVAQVVSRGPRSFTLFHGLFFWATCFSSEHVILCLCLYLSASPRNPKIGSIRAWPAVVLSSWKQECKERAESQQHHSDTEKTAANLKRGYCVDLTCLTALVCLRFNVATQLAPKLYFGIPMCLPR